MTSGRASTAGWRTTFVDTLALSFVFLILLARPPAPDDARLAPVPVAEPSLPRPAIGMLASSLRRAVGEGTLIDGTVTSRGHEVTVTLSLPWPDETQIIGRIRSVAGLAATHGPATLEIVLLLPDRPNDEAYRRLAKMALEVPASWLVQVADGQPQLRMIVDPVDG